MTAIAIEGPRQLREDLLVELVSHLAAKGRRVAVAIDEPTATIDRARKDTGRHQAAGAMLTLGSSPHHSSLIGKRSNDEKLDAFLPHMKPADVMLVSGEGDSLREPRIVIQPTSSDAGQSVTLHRADGTTATSPLADIGAVAKFVKHQQNGQTS